MQPKDKATKSRMGWRISTVFIRNSIRRPCGCYKKEQKTGHFRKKSA